MNHHRASPSPITTQYHSVLPAAYQLLEQAPPPSLREILAAYNMKGDGDRDMLIAMLNAKSAEDQRLASLASLHRQVLEIYTASSAAGPSPLSSPAAAPMPLMTPPSPPSSTSSRKHIRTELPPSPRSETASGEYSPRSRASMTIDSLLTASEEQRRAEEEEMMMQQQQQQQRSSPRRTRSPGNEREGHCDRARIRADRRAQTSPYALHPVHSPRPVAA